MNESVNFNVSGRAQQLIFDLVKDSDYSGLLENADPKYIERVRRSISDLKVYINRLEKVILNSNLNCPECWGGGYRRVRDHSDCNLFRDEYIKCQNCDGMGVKDLFPDRM